MWVEEKECTVCDIIRGSEFEVTFLEVDIFILIIKYSYW